MFILGIIIHLTFLYSIFDIYFKSPIVQNVTPYQPQHRAVADRLVLFVVDGLRAESFVNYTTMSYLRSVANSNGRWGISNTQVPTESRPGHVALIAGFYEDPSAIFRGWKENPVDFDSVFNQTTNTWSWGTYDIVNIFTKGIADDHIAVEDFDPYAQSFSTNKNTSQLDAWVFDKVKIFFHIAKSNTKIEEKLKKDKIVFFLHLLGADTAGHTHKPKTSNFLTTIKHVDEGIQDIEKIIRNYYGDDGRTTFLMTSDHGMTDWGSHGSGDNHETETPYVIWGSGVQQVNKSQLDPYTLEMSLEHRLDVSQVDLAPLMATILSIPVPVNSIASIFCLFLVIGLLFVQGKPINGLLNMTLPDRAKAMYSISRQLASQYDKKRQDIRTNVLPVLYQPYEPFTKRKFNEMIAFTEKLLQDQNYEELIIFSKEIVDLSFSGLRYYHDYFQKPLLVLVTLSFLGWAVWLLRVLAEQKFSLQTVGTSRSTTNSNRISVTTVGRNAVLFIMFFIGSYLVYVQNLPIQYYLYLIMALLLWFKALFPVNVWAYTLKQLRSSNQLTTLCFDVISYVIGSLALGMSFTYRWTLSIPLLGMGLWPVFTSTRCYLSTPMVYLWSIGSLFLSGFAFMPVVGKDTFVTLVLLAGFAWIGFLCVYIYCVLIPLKGKGEEANMRERKLIAVQVAMLLLALYNIYEQGERFDRGTPVNYVDQTVAWAIAVISPLLPLLYSKRMVNRLTAINTSLITFYLMMSVAHEGLFIVSLALHVICWIIIEFSLLGLEKMEIVDCTFDSEKHKNINEIYIERSLTRQDFRRAFFFVCYIILAFFGTGNIASLNSFEVRWVTCFVTSFQPFLITTLILLKTFAPFLVVGCGFVAVQLLTEGTSRIQAKSGDQSTLKQTCSRNSNTSMPETSSRMDAMVEHQPVLEKTNSYPQISKSSLPESPSKTESLHQLTLGPTFPKISKSSLPHNPSRMEPITGNQLTTEPNCCQISNSPNIPEECITPPNFHVSEAPIGCLNIIVLVYSNLMGIQLLYNVRNTGSWLEIGTSISQFVIVQLITVFIVIINSIAKLYSDVSIAGRIYKNRKKYV